MDMDGESKEGSPKMSDSIPLLHNQKLVDQANQLPINQEAKRWLRVAQAEYDQSSLYLLQLILWGVEQKRLPVGSAQRSSLEQAAYQLLSFQPEKALKFLLMAEDSEAPESNLSVDHLESERSPLDAAWEAVQALDRSLMENVDDYPPRELR
jgi:hypothetical protein